MVQIKIVKQFYSINCIQDLSRVLKYATFGVFYTKIFWDDSTEVTEGVTLTPDIFGCKNFGTTDIWSQSFLLTFFKTNTIYI